MQPSQSLCFPSYVVVCKISVIHVNFQCLLLVPASLVSNSVSLPHFSLNVVLVTASHGNVHILKLLCTRLDLLSSVCIPCPEWFWCYLEWCGYRCFWFMRAFGYLSALCLRFHLPSGVSIPLTVTIVFLMSLETLWLQSKLFFILSLSLQIKIYFLQTTYHIIYSYIISYGLFSFVFHSK